MAKFVTSGLSALSYAGSVRIRIRCRIRIWFQKKKPKQKKKRVSKVSKPIGRRRKRRRRRNNRNEKNKGTIEKYQKRQGPARNVPGWSPTKATNFCKPTRWVSVICDTISGTSCKYWVGLSFKAANIKTARPPVEWPLAVYPGEKSICVSHHPCSVSRYSIDFSTSRNDVCPLWQKLSIAQLRYVTTTKPCETISAIKTSYANVKGPPPKLPCAKKCNGYCW